MTESCLENNIRKYPKLKQLVITDVAKRNVFLQRILNIMKRSSLTYRQAVVACQVIDEELNK